MPFFKIDKRRVFFRWAGNPEGPVLVLSHSLGSSCELWDAQIESLGARFRLLLYDLRGHGRSDCPEGEWTIDDFGNDVLGLLDSLKLERIHFCGVSLGGMVGLWLAARAPERIDRLIVANTSAYTEDPALLRGRMKQIAAEGLGAAVDGVLDRWFTSAFHESHPEVIRKFRGMVLATSDRSYIAGSAAVCAVDLRGDLPKITAPVLVITGRWDRATPPGWGRAIAAAIPGAEFRELEAAHLSNVEAAGAFDAAAKAFLKK